MSRPPPSSGPTSGPTARGTAHAYRLLIVDDDPNILELLGEALKHAADLPNETVLAADPKLALEHLGKAPFDLVLSDFKMPEMDGIDLLLEIKAKWPKTLRMLMTAHSTKRMALAAVLTAEVHSYIEKPFEPGDVVGTIREALLRRNPFVEGLVTVVDSSEQAIKLVTNLHDALRGAPSEATELSLTLSFPSPIDFNRFTFRLFQSHLAEVRDVHFVEGKFVITVVVRPGTGTSDPPTIPFERSPRGQARGRPPAS